MAYEEGLRCITLEAGADLSTKQYLFMVQATDGQVDPAGTQGIDVTGVLQNKPDAAGKAATIAIEGISKVVAGGAINPGALVMTSNAGKALTAASTALAVGRHVGKVAAADGDIIPVLLIKGAGHFALA